MEIRKIDPHHMLSADPQGRSKEVGKKEQLRTDWGYTNQYRRMMQRRREQNREITSGE